MLSQWLGGVVHISCTQSWKQVLSENCLGVYSLRLDKDGTGRRRVGLPSDPATRPCCRAEPNANKEPEQ